MKRYFLISLILLIAPTILLSQNEKNHWFFGQNAYIDFNTATPTISTGPLSTGEGCATVSDGSGALLFYTDGITVYDNTGAIMVNGTGLKGDPSSTHSALVVPNPCDSDIYYIFTTAAEGQDGMYHYTVDLSLTSTTNGEVVLGSETLMLIDATEKIAATKHANSEDFWVVTIRQASGFSEVYSWLVSQAGVSTTPNVYTSPNAIIPAANGTNCGTNGDYLGQLKFSNDGSLLAEASLFCSREINLFTFNTNTGFATSYVTSLNDITEGPYGIEFSPNGNYLYTSEYSPASRNIFQYDISNISSIGAPNPLGQSGGNRGGALQLSPDGNSIYVAERGSQSLGQITNINTATAVLTPGAQPLAAGTLSDLGLPTFVSGTQNFSGSCLDLDPFVNAVPTLFSTAVKNELNDNPFFGKDKEYGDVDNDGDIDILYTKTGDELHILENTAGPGVTPVYNLPGTSAFGPDFWSYSYRYYDWNGDNWNDIIVLGTDNAATSGVWYFQNNGSGGFPPTGTLILDGTTDFNFSIDYLIAIGDLNNDSDPDLLLSNQDGVLDGTAYFENTGGTSPYFILPLPQMYNGTAITFPFIPDNSGSYHTPEIYDADCDGDLDVFISDPLVPGPTFGGARMYFHENSGATTNNMLPDVNATGVINQFGFNDDPGLGSNLACDWIITRIVPFINPNCPIAISYNPCSQEFYYYDQDCGCDGTGTSVLAIEDVSLPEQENKIKIYPNPARNEFNLWSNTTIDSYRIYSVQGQLMMENLYNNEAIRIDNLSPGIYFVNVISEGKSQTLRLLVK